MSRSRRALAVSLGIFLCLAVVIPLALAINRFDWGVGLILLAPLLIWGLIRSGRALDGWSRNARRTPPVDPDFPDDEE